MNEAFSVAYRFEGSKSMDVKVITIVTIYSNGCLSPFFRSYHIYKQNPSIKLVYEGLALLA